MLCRKRVCRARGTWHAEQVLLGGEVVSQKGVWG